MNYLDYYRHLLDDPDIKNRVALMKTGFWGERAAGCLFLAHDTQRLCLARRSDRVREPYTWGTWGGAIDGNENPEKAVRREVWEETGYEGELALYPLATFSHNTFKYYNFLGIVSHEFRPQLNSETMHFRWVEYGDWPRPLHFGMKYVIKESGEIIQKAIAILKRK